MALILLIMKFKKIMKTYISSYYVHGDSTNLFSKFESSAMQLGVQAVAKELSEMFFLQMGTLLL